MNDEHSKALIELAKFYGGSINPNKAKMLDLTSLAMRLEVDGQLMEIAFDHELTDSGDAHRTLVAMLRKSLKTT